MPTFSGNYSDWETFRDLYRSLIHENKQLSKVEKLHYLKSNVVGEDEELLKHILILNVNYDSALENLAQRYNNRRIILNNILHRLKQRS